MTTVTETASKVEPLTRIQVLTGEDGDPMRRGSKSVIARSECTYYCPDQATAERCIASLRESDERLRNRPDELMLWDWMNTWFEPEPDNPNGGGTVLLGVAWYSEEFFQDRKDAWFGSMHKHVYKQIGIPLEDISVTHWRAL